MSEAVDTRIVEAKFDSAQFEKGVDKTVKKLDELKQSLNLKDSGKSIADLGAKVQDATDKASKSLEKLENRMTSFIGMLKQKLLGGIADEIVGAFFKMKNSVESFVSSLSTGQIGYGMQRYTDILNSVRVLVSAGTSQSKAYEAIERLGLYADQTSYSLDQMVATMSKFKTAGADLDTATRMIEGLSNAAASMGVNATDAARAYLNLQQAYSKKVMLSNDWISFESLPMVGTKFNEAILKAAEKVGTLEVDKKDDEGNALSYKTKKKAGTKVTSGRGITADNLGSMLQYRWFTDEVMEEVFGHTYYFSEIGITEVNRFKEEEKKIRAQVKQDIVDGKVDSEKYEEESEKRLQEMFNDYNKDKIKAKEEEIEARKKQIEEDKKAGKFKTTKEYKKAIEELDKELETFKKQNYLSVFGWQAFTAGQEARSFVDVLNTLKDTISRGWASSFEIIFGKLDEAKEFFTWLTESKLANAIYKIGEFRNAVLTEWKETGGRDDLLEALKILDEILGKLLGKFTIFGEDEDAIANKAESLGDSLSQASFELKNFMLRLQSWLHDPVFEDGSSRADLFASTLKNLGAVFSNLLLAVRITFSFIGDVLKLLEPVFLKISVTIGKISEKAEDATNPNSGLAGLQSVFGAILAAVMPVVTVLEQLLDALDPVLAAVGRSLTKVITAFTDLLNPDISGTDPYQDVANIFTNIYEIVKPLLNVLPTVIDILGDIGAFFVSVAASTVTTNLQFISDMLGLALEIFTGRSAQKNNGQGVWDGIVADIKALGDACKSALQYVSDFFTALFDDVRRWLGISKEAGEEASEDGGIFKNIGNFFHGLFWKKEYNETTYQNIKKYSSVDAEKYKDAMRGPLGALLNKVIEGAKDFIKSIPQTIANLLDTFWNAIAGTFTSDENAFDEKVYNDFLNKKDFKGAEKYKKDHPVKTATRIWFEGAVQSIKDFIKSIPQKIKNLPNILSEFLKPLFWKKGYSDKAYQEIKKYSTVDAEKYRESMKGPLTKIFEFIVDGVKDFIKDVPNLVTSAIQGIGGFVRLIAQAVFGTKDSAEASNDLQNELESPFKGVSLSNIIQIIKNWGIEILNQIASIFTGTTEVDKNQKWFAGKIASGFDTIKTKLDEKGPEVLKWIEDIPTKIADFFTGESKKGEEENSIGKAISGFAESVGTFISGIPNTLLEFWKNTEKGIAKLWNKIVSAITGDDGTQVKAMKVDPHKKFESVIVDSKSESKILTNINTFVQNFTKYISEKFEALPTKLSELWEGVKNWFKELPDKIAGYFNDNSSDKENDPVKQAVLDYGDKIGVFLSELPDVILNAWKSAETLISNVGSIIWNGIIDAITGKNAPLKPMKVDPHKSFESVIVDSVGLTSNKPSNQVYDNINEFIKNLIEYLGDKIEHLPEGVVNGLNKGATLLGGLMNKVTDWFKKNTTDTPTEQIADTLKDESKETSPILEALLTFGATIRDLIFHTIPDFFVAGFNWVKEKGTAIWDALSGVFSSNNAEGSIDNGIQSLAEKIINGIKSLPDKIKSGTDWLKEHLLDNLFKGSSQADKIQEVYKKQGSRAAEEYARELAREGNANAMNAAVEKRLKTIKANQEYISKEYKKILDEQGFDSAESYKRSLAGKDLTEPLTKEIEEELNKAPESFDLWGLIKNVGESIVYVFKNIGPYVLEGLNSVLTWIGGKIEWLTAVFNDKKEEESLGDAVGRKMEEENSNEPSALVQALKKIGETIKKLIVEIIPNFIKSGISVLTQEIPKMFSNLFGREETNKQIEENLSEGMEAITGVFDAGNEYLSTDEVTKKIQEMEAQMAGLNAFAFNTKAIENTKDAKENAEKIAENTGGIISMFSDLLQKSTVGGVTALVALLSVIGLIVWKINSIIDNLIVTDDPYLFMKWAAINTAVKLIAGLITYMTILASTGSQDQLQAIYDMFEKVESFIMALGGFYVMIKSMQIGTEVKEGFWGTLGNFLWGGAKTALIVGGVVEGGKFITEGLSSWAEDITEAFNWAKIGFSDLKDAVEIISEIKDELDQTGELFIAVRKFFINMRDVFADERTLETSKDGSQTVTVVTENLRGDIESILDMFTRLSGVMANFKTSISGRYVKAKEITDALEKLMGLRYQMIGFASFSNTQDFEDFKYAISSLGAALSMYSGNGFEKVPSEASITKTIETVIAIIQNEKLKAFADTINDNGLPDAKDIYKNSEKIVMLASAVASIGEASKNINKNTGGYLELLFATLSQIQTPLAKSDDEGQLTKFAQNFGVVGNAIGTFANEVKEFSADNIKNARDAMDMTIGLINSLKGSGQSLLEKWFNGDESLSSFGRQLSSFGGSLKEFLDKLAAPDMTYNKESLEQVLEAFRSIVVTFTQLSVVNKDLIKTDFGQVAKGLSGTNGMGDALNTFIKEITGENSPKLTDEAFKKIYQVTEILNQLGVFAKLSDGADFNREMQDLQTGFRDHNPFVTIVTALNSMNELVNEKSIDQNVFNYMDHLSTMFNAVAEIASVIKRYAGSTDQSHWMRIAIENIGSLFSSLNAQMDDMREFFNNMDTFDQEQVEKAALLFGSLKDLGQALTYFANNTMYASLDNLKFYDWSSFLQKLKDSMLVHFQEDEDLFAPKITPVLELSDDFVSKANQMRSMLGFDQITIGENGEFNIPRTSLNLADSIILPTDDIIKKLDGLHNDLVVVNSSMEDFNKSLASSRFIIDSHEFALIIGPAIDEYLGREDIVVDRQ